jgi:hypothetical protein
VKHPVYASDSGLLSKTNFVNIVSPTDKFKTLITLALLVNPDNISYVCPENKLQHALNDNLFDVGVTVGVCVLVGVIVGVTVGVTVFVGVIVGVNV